MYGFLSPSPRRVPLEVESLEERRVLSTADFVTGLYGVLLHRAPSTVEVSQWVGAIDNAAISPTQVALSFTTSSEYEANLIQADYQHLLGRPASGPEVGGWLAALQHGLTNQQLVANFLASPEFFVKHGNTNDGWLKGVYHAVLGRAPDAGALAGWEQALQGGTTLFTVALDIANSPEALLRVTAAAYHDILGHAPDQAGLNFWAVQLAHGMTPSQLLASLATSAEFIAARGGLDPITRPVAVPVVVPVPVFTPVDTFFFDPFFAAPVGPDFGGCGCTGASFGGFSAGSSGF